MARHHFRMCVCVLSHVRLCDRQAPLSTEFSRQEYWNGLPFPTPGDLPDPGNEPAFLASPAVTGGFFTTAPNLYFSELYFISILDSER